MLVLSCRSHRSFLRVPAATIAGANFRLTGPRTLNPSGKSGTCLEVPLYFCTEGFFAEAFAQFENRLLSSLKVNIATTTPAMDLGKSVEVTTEHAPR
jgi:hypothetical protein